MSAKNTDIYVGEDKHRHRRPKASRGRSHSTNPPSLGVYPTYRSRGAVFATSGYEYQKRRRRLVALIVAIAVIAVAVAAYVLWLRSDAVSASATALLGS